MAVYEGKFRDKSLVLKNTSIETSHYYYSSIIIIFTYIFDVVSDPPHDKKYTDISSTNIDIVTDIASAEGEELCYETFTGEKTSIILDLETVIQKFYSKSIFLLHFV